MVPVIRASKVKATLLLRRFFFFLIGRCFKSIISSIVKRVQRHQIRLPAQLPQPNIYQGKSYTVRKKMAMATLTRQKPSLKVYLAKGNSYRNDHNTWYTLGKYTKNFGLLHVPPKFKIFHENK